MTRQLAYDEAYDPPAPVVPLRVGDPRGEDAVLARALVDTGADCTLIPVSIAGGLGLPLIDRIEITGVGGGGGRAPVYAGRIELAGMTTIARLVAYEDQMILGRDLLDRLVVLLDGPQSQLRLSSTGNLH